MNGRMNEVIKGCRGIQAQAGINKLTNKEIHVDDNMETCKCITVHGWINNQANKCLTL